MVLQDSQIQKNTRKIPVPRSRITNNISGLFIVKLVKLLYLRYVRYVALCTLRCVILCIRLCLVQAYIFHFDFIFNQLFYFFRHGPWSSQSKSIFSAFCFSSTRTGHISQNVILFLMNITYLAFLLISSRLTHVDVYIGGSYDFLVDITSKQKFTSCYRYVFMREFPVLFSLIIEQHQQRCVQSYLPGLNRFILCYLKNVEWNDGME